MKTKTTNSGLKVKANLQAGGLNSGSNHNQSGLRVQVSLKAGALIVGSRNHNARLLAL